MKKTLYTRRPVRAKSNRAARNSLVPLIPPVPGLKGSARALPLRSASSAQNLEKAISSARSVLVLGASLVGLKVAEILRKRGIQVILSDVAKEILPRTAHPSSASILRRSFEEHGVEFRLGCALEGMETMKRGVAFRFAASPVEEVDFVAVCTGVRPNLDFMCAGGAGGKQAILADERMQTGVQNLYAAGDVSQAFNPFSGRHEWLGTWGNACIQGRIAGSNMAGRPMAQPGAIPQNISPFFGWAYAQMGEVKPEGKNTRSFAFGDPQEGGHFVLTFEREVLIAVNLINCTHLAGKFRNAILRKWDWGRILGHIDEDSVRPGIEQVLTRTMAPIHRSGFSMSSASRA